MVTLGVAVVPAFVPGAHGAGKAFDILLLVPSFMAGILVLNTGSAIASGGGRELISRDQAGPHPVSPTTDHLGALLPGAAQHRVDDPGLGAPRVGRLRDAPRQGSSQAEIGVVLWIVLCTALGQVVAWSMEAVRRGPGGIAISRGLLLALGLASRGRSS